MKNLRCFIIKYKGPTDFKGARVSIKDLRFNKRVLIPWDHSLNGVFDIAEAYLKSRGIKCQYMGSAGSDALIMSSDFETPIK